MKNFAYSFFNIIRDLIIGISIAILLPLVSYYIAVIFIPKSANDLVLRHLNITKYQKQSTLNDLENRKKTLERAVITLVSSQTPQAQEELGKVKEEINEINETLPSKKDEFNSINQTFQTNSNINQSYKFYINAITGILCLIIGAFIPIVSLSFGFIVGGIACIGTGYFAYWNQLTNIFKLISLLAGIIILIALAFKFAFKEKRKK